jgi:predicted SAM-dependent methyltransferase
MLAAPPAGPTMTSRLRRFLPSRRRPVDRRPSPSAPASGGPLRLHVGAGRARLEGWVNLDIQDLPGVDVVADATRGLGFSDVEAIYAEHFLEHLPVDLAIDFLVECRRCLAPRGRLRLSTPNLAWVWLTHYHPEAPADVKRREAVIANRAFYGWRHRFLWNRELLATTLEACGFDGLAWCRWGESEHEVFRGVERHETYDDAPEMSHVLVVEAARAEEQPAALAELRRTFEEELLRHRED